MNLGYTDRNVMSRVSLRISLSSPLSSSARISSSAFNSSFSISKYFFYFISSKNIFLLFALFFFTYCMCVYFDQFSLNNKSFVQDGFCIVDFGFSAVRRRKKKSERGKYMFQSKIKGWFGFLSLSSSKCTSWSRTSQKFVELSNGVLLITTNI